MNYKDYQSYKTLCIEHYKNWNTSIKKSIHELTVEQSQEIINFCNNVNPSLVIDTGCDRNIFKYKIKNLVGFDIRDIEGPDYIGSFADLDSTFKSNSADIVLCLGSLNFGSKKIIDYHLSLCAKWCKPGGFLVMRVASNHPSNLRKMKHNWKYADIEEFSNKYSLKIISDIKTITKPTGDNPRLTWIWQLT